MQPFAASKPLVAALEKNGVDHRYFVAEHSGHGLQNDNRPIHKSSGICDREYHGSQGASRWFCKIYHDKAVEVRFICKVREF